VIVFSREDIRRLVPTAAYKRGSSYWLEGQVKNLRSVAQPNGALLIHGEVQGSAPQPYVARVLISPGRGGQVTFEASCTCPVGYHCKHVAAVLLEALAGGYEQTPSPPTPATTPLVFTTLKNADWQNRGSPSSNSPSSAPKPNVESPLESWLRQLQDATALPNPDDYPPTLKQRLLYLLQLREPGQQARLQVELVSARLLKEGGYSMTHSFKGDGAGYIRPVDRSLLKWLGLLQNYRSGYSAPYDLQGTEAVTLLQQMLATGRCHWQHKGNPPLQLGPQRRATPQWQVAQDGTQRLLYQVEGGAEVVLPLVPPWYLDLSAALCGPLDTGLPAGLASTLLTAPSLAPAQASQVREFLGKHAPHLPQPQNLQKVRQEKRKPLYQIRLFNSALEPLFVHRWRYHHDTQIFPLLRLTFLYGEVAVVAGQEPGGTLNYYDPHTDTLVQVQRNKAAEQKALKRLQELGFVAFQAHPLFAHFQVPAVHHTDLLIGQDNPFAREAEQALLNFSLSAVPQLRSEGWSVEMDANYLYQTLEPHLIEDWYVEIDDSSGIDWFGLELGIQIEQERVNLLPLLVKLLHNLSNAGELTQLQTLPDDSLLTPRLEDGRILPLPVGRVRNILGVLVELLDFNALDDNGRLQLLHLRAAQLLELEGAMGAAQLRWLGGERLRELGLRLRDFNGIKSVPVPEGFQTTLRPYQQEGLNWLQFLREYRLGGILADDMGLGKTVQTLAHILIEKRSGRLNKPCLVVAPTSLMVNWRQESKRFAPELRVLTLHGPARKALFEQMANHDLVLTTYPLLARDREALLAHHYHLLVLDEAQNIKNPKAKVTQIVHQIQVDHRLCLTGTPMENHLGELWSLFHFLIPGLLGDAAHFRQLFRMPIEKDGDSARRSSLTRRIAPFLLRRTKEQVVTELPEKNEIVRSVELEGGQRDLYETIRLAMHSRVRKEIAEKGMARSQIVILDALLKLRQVCCDPRLLKLDSAQKVKQSAKLSLLMDLVPEMIEEGRRILLFSQFTSMLSLIELELKREHIDYVKLTGQTRNRGEVVNRFQAGEVPLFLISLKAGGTGLNLTAADTVIHYDPWWNPAVENQATDRAHRIGQEKRVFVYKLLTAGTVEEKIQELQMRKQQLADALFDEGQGSTQLLLSDLESLFEPLS